MFLKIERIASRFGLSQSTDKGLLGGALHLGALHLGALRLLLDNQGEHRHVGHTEPIVIVWLQMMLRLLKFGQRC